MDNQAPQLSIGFSDLGLYYDAISLSRLESLVSKPLSEGQLRRAQALIGLWREARVSKYNSHREFSAELPDSYVLVTDQLQGGLFDQAASATLDRMLVTALDENPDSIVILFIPDKKIKGKKPSYCEQKGIKENPRIQVLKDDIHSVKLIEQAEAIYTINSHIGFEGLLWAKKVCTFGPSFYSDWGLTEDIGQLSIFRPPVLLKNFVYAILIDYYQYIDPETGEFCELERLLEWICMQRKMRERFPAKVYALGFSFHKKPVVRDFFQGSEVHFCNSSVDIPENETVVYWSRKFEQDILLIKASNIIRLEDGFIRSVGLGADLIRPISWVMDRQGIYFDATQPSDLENILLTSEFNEQLLNRALNIRNKLVAHALTKYNVGADSWHLPIKQVTDNVDGEVYNQISILVPGQVEADASLAYGAPGIKRNLDLLKAVRNANPEAYIIYKPHPDVVAGLRYAGQDEGSAGNWCDEVVIDVSMGAVLSQIDEVHTLTSLTGFEALLRGKKVVCYGQPFYSGWGLTDDVIPVLRRGLSLSLNELVAGVLILYPVYMSRSTGKFTTPERALEELLIWRNQKRTILSIIGQKILRMYLQWTKAS